MRQFLTDQNKVLPMALLAWLLCLSGLSVALEQAPFETEASGAELLPNADEKPEVKLKLFQNTHHLLQGRADADYGRLKFKSRLFANNEVKFTLSIDDEEEQKLHFTAYFDLTSMTMELDGGGAVLDADQKKLMRQCSELLSRELMSKYEDPIPEHGFMLVQMLGYWSHSPENYQHNKRVIETSY